MSEYKTSLADILAGDEVVLQRSGYISSRRFQLVKVTHVTPKQIVIGEDRYWRESGKSVGGGDAWHRECISPPGKEWNKDITYAQRAEHEQATNEVRDLARQFDRIDYSIRTQSKTLEQLYQIADLLEQALEILK